MNFKDYDEDTMMKNLQMIISELGYDQVNIIGHSFGTMMASWFVKRYPESVKNLILLDPVSLLLFLPRTSFGFLHEAPTSVAERIIRWFAARDLTIAYNIMRNFNWRECNLIPTDIPDHIKMTIGLSPDDNLIPFQSIRKSFESRAQLIEWSGAHFHHVATSDQLPLQIREILS